LKLFIIIHNGCDPEPSTNTRTGFPPSSSFAPALSSPVQSPAPSNPPPPQTTKPTNIIDQYFTDLAKEVDENNAKSNSKLGWIWDYGTKFKKGNNIRWFRCSLCKYYLIGSLLFLVYMELIKA